MLLGRVTGIDRARPPGRDSTTGASRYDWLIVATGARHAYFGHDDWEPHAPGPEDDRRRDGASAAAS